MSWQAALDPEQSPRFVHDFEAVAATLRMVHKQLLPERYRPAFTANELPTTRFSIVVAKWCWQPVEHLKYKTYLGMLDLARDSIAVIKKAAAHGWRIDLMTRDTRTSHEHAKMNSNKYVLATEYHGRTFHANEVWAHRAAAVGALPDHRHLNKSIAVGRQEVQGCHCGQPAPDRRHMMWRCAPVSQTHQPKNNLEEALAVRCVTMHRQPRLRTFSVDWDLVHALSQNASDGVAVCATDGGSLNQKAAGIGIAVARPASEQFEVAFTTGAVVNGADQSNWAAELDAVHTLVLAAYVAKVRVYVFIDNKDVQVTFKMLNQGELIVPRYGFQRWLDLKAHVQHDMKHDCEWIPSHDKRPDWTPLHSIITAQQARKLNAGADEHAT